MLHLFHEYGAFFVFAALILEPNPDNPWRQARHLHHLLLHERVRSTVGSVTCPRDAGGNGTCEGPHNSDRRHRSSYLPQLC